MQLASTVPKWGLKPGCAPHKKVVVGLLKTRKSEASCSDAVVEH